MTLLWKLLRSHLSVAQTLGFALAGLVGMTVVLTALQAYRDVLPVFEGPDSFAEGDYLVLSKRVGTLQAIGIGNSDFTPEELEELRAQPFVREVGVFTPADLPGEGFGQRGRRRVFDLPVLRVGSRRISRRRNRRVAASRRATAKYPLSFRATT